MESSGWILVELLIVSGSEQDVVDHMNAWALTSRFFQLRTCCNLETLGLGSESYGGICHRAKAGKKNLPPGKRGKRRWRCRRTFCVTGDATKAEKRLQSVDERCDQVIQAGDF